MKNLLLTLGHNASAILIEDNEIVWGYENERVTGVKSDSRFPSAALEYARDQGFWDGKCDMVYATHWAPDGKLSSMGAKYWDPSYFDGVPVRTLSVDCSHHDTHMAAAICYAGKSFPTAGSIGLVVDGFGTHGEHLSVYDLQNGERTLLKRVYGYSTSLGLWYQYATAFLGMKMHEDEYKILGYEAHIDHESARIFDKEAEYKADLWIDEMSRIKYADKYDPLFDLQALPQVKDLIWSHLTDVARRNGVADPTSHEGRIKMGYYVQAVLEAVVLRIVDGYGPTNVLLTGGVFHNVKLNKFVMDHVEGKTCVMPLCGDQGNALGLYAMDHPEFAFPKDLFWGKRKLKDVGKVPNMLYVDNEADALKLLQGSLAVVGRVNLVRGHMEFGPRGLCNTSTLAVPTLANVEAINKANDRNTVMPMAPVMTKPQWQHLFEDTAKSWKSHKHMILAMEYAEYPDDDMLGVCHKYTWPHNYQTGRPQVTDDPLMVALLTEFDPLINTSFNYHGKPICLGMEQIVESHMLELDRDPSTFTIVITNC